MNGKVARRIRKIIYQDTNGKDPKRKYKTYGRKDKFGNFIPMIVVNSGKRYNYQLAKAKYYARKKGEKV